MSKIEKFFIVCIKCATAEKVLNDKVCKVTIDWRPERAFVFICYNCGEYEIKKLDFSNPKDITPKNEDEFEKSIKDKN